MKYPFYHHASPLLALLTALVYFPISATADSSNTYTPDSHAPIGVMGDHRHQAGEVMISYRYMSMGMEDNLSGDDSISAADIVTSVTNPFAGPPTVRVVPIDMTTSMHMLGMMYAPNDTITLMAMFNYIEKEMDHLTFMGPAGTTELGQFTTESNGVGDTKLGLLWGLGGNNGHNLHMNLGLSLPTGSIDETASVLTPMNMRPTFRMPYAMQLGSGTFDIEPGITYYANHQKLGWGVQAKAVFRLGENDENYTLGNVLNLNCWASYRLADFLSGSLRLTYSDTDSIDGNDTNIAAPVQTANPDNYGGKRLDASVGVNTVNSGGHRIAFEYTVPVQQDVNGVQMEMQSMWTLGYQYAFE